MTLAEFLDHAAAEPFADGTADCVLMVSDWVVECGHPDPAAPFRGRYRTALGRERIVRREGGMLAVMRGGARRAGLAEAERPVPGDVGLVEMNGLTLAAICTGLQWAAKGQGLIVSPAEHVLGAWRV